MPAFTLIMCFKKLSPSMKRLPSGSGLIQQTRVSWVLQVRSRDLPLNAWDHLVIARDWLSKRYEKACLFGTSWREISKIVLKPAGFMLLTFSGRQISKRTSCFSHARDACSRFSKWARGCQELKMAHSNLRFRATSSPENLNGGLKNAS